MIRSENWSEFHHDSTKKVSGPISFENLLLWLKETHPLKPQKADGRRPQVSDGAANRPRRRNNPVVPDFCTCEMCPAQGRTQDFLKGRARVENFIYSGQYGAKNKLHVSSLPCYRLPRSFHKALEHMLQRQKSRNLKGLTHLWKSRRIYQKYMPTCSVGSTNSVCNFLPKNIE